MERTPTERPRRRLPQPARAIVIGLAAAVAAGAIATLPFETSHRAAADPGDPSASSTTTPSDAAPAPAPIESPTPDALLTAPRSLGYPFLAGTGEVTWASASHVLVPSPAKVGNDIPPGGCVITGTAPTAKVCWQGDPTARTTIALVGDSHAFQWLGAFDRMAKEHHWRLLSIIHNSCPFDTTKRTLEKHGYTHCQPAIASAMKLIAKSHVKVLVTSTYRPAYADEQAAGIAGYVSLWARLKKEGVAVIALGDTPQPIASPTNAQCVAGPAPEHCGVARRVAEQMPDTLRAAAKRAHVPFVDPVSAFCRATWCPGVIGSVIVYRDKNHVSNTYLDTALPWLDAKLAPVVRAAVHAPRPRAST